MRQTEQITTDIVPSSSYQFIGDSGVQSACPGWYVFMDFDTTELTSASRLRTFADADAWENDVSFRCSEHPSQPCFDSINIEEDNDVEARLRNKSSEAIYGRWSLYSGSE